MMMSEIMTLIMISFMFIIGITLVLNIDNINSSITELYNQDDDTCSICGSYYAEEQLLKGNDPGTCDGGLYFALNQIWYDCNFGKHNTDLSFLESVRIKYNYSKIHNFLSINYNNPCPSSPSIKHLGTGYITDYTASSYEGPAYSITKIQYNNTTHTFNNCGWNPYPYNRSSLTYVFQKKGGSWFNQFKEAELYDTQTYPNKLEETTTSWSTYQTKYQKYLSSGGIDIGDGYP